MVDTGERGSYKAQSEEKGNRLKNAKSNSLRTQQAVARFGEAARYPLCQAALQLWSMDADLFKEKKDAELTKISLNTAQQLKKTSRALLDQFYREGKQKETIEAAALCRGVNENLPKLQKAYQAQLKRLAIYEEMWLRQAGLFGRELLAAESAKDSKAIRALRQVKKRFDALTKRERLKDGELRELGILQMLRDKKIKAEWAKGEALDGWMEAAFGGNRPLSDDEWQGRLTAREIHSGLMATYGAGVAGDKHAKEIRRIAKKLGIRLDADRPGRKWKGPSPERTKKSRGRPRINPDIEHADLEIIEAVEARRRQHGDGLKGTEIHNAKKEYSLKAARRDWKRIASEINRLTLVRGGHKSELVSTTLPTP